MENKLIQATAKSLARWMNRYANKEGLELQKLELGLEAYIINTTNLIIIYLLAALLGSLAQTAIIHFAFIIIKRYSFGVHALNSTVCTLVSCFTFVITPLLVSNMGVNNFGVLVVFVAVISFLYRYAPADTKARPIIGATLRGWLKMKAVVCGLLLMVIALVVPNEHFKLLLSLGAVFQCISIFPLTYKILRRSERNYEKYECA